MLSTPMDFVDLDDEDNFVDNKFYSQSRNESTSLFISSNSELCQLNNYHQQRHQPGQNNNKTDVTLQLDGDRRVIFNPKGQRFEGRDSQVFKGQLFKDEDVGFYEQVAVKVSNEAVVAKEAVLSALLNSSEFVQLRGHGAFPISSSRHEFISIWEWIDGGNLESVALKHPEIFASQEFKFKTIKSLALALDKMHSIHIAHHDLKPHNILFTSNLDRLVIIDFGDSKLLDCKNNDDQSILPIDEGIGLGTLAYTAPELLSRKSEFYDPFSVDVYSFGVLLYYILNDGKILPFQSLIPHRAVQLILTVQKGFFAGGYNPESPAHSPFYPLMLKCLQADPNSRPKSKEILNFVFDVAIK